jgi:hypothetical protein
MRVKLLGMVGATAALIVALGACTDTGKANSKANANHPSRPPAATQSSSSCSKQIHGPSWGTQPQVEYETSPGTVIARPEYRFVNPDSPCFNSVTFTIDAAALAGYDVRYIKQPLQPLNPAKAKGALPMPGGNDLKLQIIVKARPNGQFTPGTMLHNDFAGGRFYTLGGAQDGSSTGYALAPQEGQRLAERPFRVTRQATADGHFTVTIAIAP